MELTIDYEDEIYQIRWTRSLDELEFVDILTDRRPLLHCWLKDHETNVWIRIPRINVLTALLKVVPVGTVATLRFQASIVSPNTPPPTKKEIAPELAGEVWALSLVANVIEPFTRRPIAEIEVGELVVIQASTDISAPRLSFHAQSLLHSIRVDAERGISPFNVVVRAEDEHAQFHEIQLTKRVWMNSLLRGNDSADAFLEYVLTGFDNLFKLGDKLKELHSNTDLWLRLKCFHYDLKRFDPEAQGRLNNYGGEYYMSNRYFSSDEVQFLLDFPTASGATARQSLQILFESKGSSMAEVCTSHDVTPAVERLYGIRKGFETEKAFKAYFKTFSKYKGTY